MSKTIVHLRFDPENPPRRFRDEWEAHPESSLYFEAVYLLLYPLMPPEWWHGTTKTENCFNKSKISEIPINHNKKNKLASIDIYTLNGNSVSAFDKEGFIDMMLQLIDRYCGVCWYIQTITYDRK